MARPFDSTDAKRIIERHRKLLAELMLAEKSIDGLRTAITKTSDALVAQEVLNLLKNIPVDELNRDKQRHYFCIGNAYGRCHCCHTP